MEGERMGRRRTYTASLAGAHVEGQAVLVVGVAHEDGDLDSRERGTGQGLPEAAAEGVVHDLASLGVADHDDLSVGAALVEAVDGRDDGRGALLGRGIVLDAAARRLTAAGRVVDGLGLGAGEGALDLLDQAARGAEALGRRRLARAEDEDVGAVGALAGLERLDGRGAGQTGGEDGENSGGLHGDDEDG